MKTKALSFFEGNSLSSKMEYLLKSKPENSVRIEYRREPD